MGLDMYLSGLRYVTGYQHSKDDEQQRFRALVKVTDLEPLAEPDHPSATLTVCIAYWRKANAIHHWFVENVQDGTDDCREYDVGTDQLEDLLAAVKGEIKAYPKSGKLLPPAEGFFFGGTEIDQYYLDNLLYTKERLELIIPYNDPFISFVYRASW